MASSFVRSSTGCLCGAIHREPPLLERLRVADVVDQRAHNTRHEQVRVCTTIRCSLLKPVECWLFGFWEV